MSDPKLHHYVPQFYLRRFCDQSGRVWAWDRDEDRVFPASPKSIAAEKSFYRLDRYADEDPLAMERQFAELESGAAQITGQWVEWIRAEGPLAKISIPPENRHAIAQFLALQFIRTADFRDVISTFAAMGQEGEMSEVEKRVLHTDVLWNQEFIDEYTRYIDSAIWMFGKNETSLPFITSDNPLAFRTPDNSMWLKAGLIAAKTYAVYPLAPDIVMYCFPRAKPWLGAEALDTCISPVAFTEDLIESENTGQVFMASRFVVSNRNDFEMERTFAKTIGTDEYAAYWRDRDGPDTG